MINDSMNFLLLDLFLRGYLPTYLFLRPSAVLSKMYRSTYRSYSPSKSVTLALGYDIPSVENAGNPSKEPEKHVDPEVS